VYLPPISRGVNTHDQPDSHGRCYSVAPKLLSDDDEGFVTLRGSSMEIADNQLADAGEAAAAACPPSWSGLIAEMVFQGLRLSPSGPRLREDQIQVQ
jgi:ferredoxin